MNLLKLYQDYKNAPTIDELINSVVYEVNQHPGLPDKLVDVANHFDDTSQELLSNGRKYLIGAAVGIAVKSTVATYQFTNFLDDVTFSGLAKQIVTTVLPYAALIVIPWMRLDANKYEKQGNIQMAEYNRHWGVALSVALMTSLAYIALAPKIMGNIDDRESRIYSNRIVKLAELQRNNAIKQSIGINKNINPIEFLTQPISKTENFRENVYEALFIASDKAFNYGSRLGKGIAHLYGGII